MRPASGDVLTGRSRKSSGADLSPPGSVDSATSSTSTAAASPSMVTYFLANESAMSNVSGSTSSSQAAPASQPRRTSIASPNDAEDLLLRRRRLSGKLEREDTLTPDTPKPIPILAPPFAISSMPEAVRDDDAASDCEKPPYEGLESEPLTDDEDVERSSNLSFPLSITDTLPPGSPAKPLSRNFSPGPSLPTNSLASTRNTSSKSLADSFADGENPLSELQPRKSGKGKGRITDPRDPTVIENLDDSTLSTQFIMPTIRMPSRRPFTARGKELGRLKILVAGDSGIGKTSLIKSMIQANEDIVHVDPWVYTTPDSSVTSSFYGGKDNLGTTNALTEIYGSTKPYPTWWSDFEDSRVLRRRKSSGETVLERNVCFVDTPGYGAGTSYSECIEPVFKYVERQLERTTSIMNGDEGDQLSFLTGNGSPQVDVVLYVILHRLKPVDIDFMRRLSSLTNVFPVIAKSDTLTATQTTELKLSILNDLRNAGIRAFLFGKSADDVARGLPSCPPFATSSAQAPDETMDASLLMSPEYVPPLVASELDELINHLFDPDNASWLRHSSTKKFLSWKASHPALNPTIIPNPSPPSSSTQLIRSRSPSYGKHSSLIPLSGTGVGHGITGTSSSFVLARVADHTRREEHMAQLHLAKWAADLQKSIKAERERFERIAKGDRAIWLTEKLGECVIDGSLVPLDKMGKMLVKTSSGETMAVEPIVRFGKGKMGAAGLDRRDPMGWLKLNQQVRKGAYLLVQITGTAGVVGVITIFVVKYVFGATPAWMQRLGI
ncbi:hypothetical protein H072_2052 [Dactylellina haptotyla CBS 200.50]|uniref:Septin-type G domain-containing protein n=1 Tax=Dactylellina haptotyla (strain CBS 200.50) TaxID=1284197 RepID=S8C8G7_DACHA|nr:hypothetical protein H072_2052 [Dactylellina haptotyla CBS 200.50]